MTDTKTRLENEILEAVKVRCREMEKYDAERQEAYNRYMQKAEATDDEYWKKDYEGSARWELQFQHHGYDFLEGWKNIIAKVMYNRIFLEWHSASCSARYSKGHGGYYSSELTNKEREVIGKIFNSMVTKGFFKVSKSGYKAKFTKAF